MNLTPVESSHIAAIGYLEAERVLLVRYKDGSLYAQPGWNSVAWENLQRAPSKGKAIKACANPMVLITKGVMPTDTAGPTAIELPEKEPADNAAPSAGSLKPDSISGITLIVPNACLDVIDEDADKCCRKFFAALGPSGLCVAEALTCRDCGTQFIPSTVGPNRHWRIVPTVAIVSPRR